MSEIPMATNFVESTFPDNNLSRKLWLGNRAASSYAASELAKGSKAVAMLRMARPEGLNPSPPDLKEVAPLLEPRQLFWVIKNGIRMTGMPSFGMIEVPDAEIWKIVAFLKKLPLVTDQDYKTWTAAP